MSRYRVKKDPWDFVEHTQTELARLFPLQSSRDFDSIFENFAQPIGFNEDCPEDLKLKLLAVLLSMQLGLKSVDYTLARYLKNRDFRPSEREDIKICEFIRGSHSFCYDLIHEITHHDDPRVGRVLAEWALLRQEFSSLQLMTLANRGALFEGHAIARIQLEQLAWVCAIDAELDEKVIKSVKAQASISKLKAIDARAGMLYGFLSSHAHWAPEAHVRALKSDGSILSILVASSAHKVELYIVAILILEIFMDVLFKLREIEIRRLDSGKKNYFVRRSEIVARAEHYREILASRLPDDAKNEIAELLSL